MTMKRRVPMLKRAGSEIIRAHNSRRIPLANSTSRRSLAILKILRTRRRLGLTAPSLALNSSSTTSIKPDQNVSPTTKISNFKELQFSIKIMGHRNYNNRVYDKIREIQQRWEWIYKREEDQKRLVELQGNDSLRKLVVFFIIISIKCRSFWR